MLSFGLLRRALLTAWCCEGDRLGTPLRALLFPAFNNVIDSWWPDPLPTGDRGAVLYFVPRDVAAAREGQGGSYANTASISWREEAARPGAVEGASRSCSHQRSCSVRPLLPVSPSLVSGASPELIAGLPHLLGLCYGVI